MDNSSEGEHLYCLFISFLNIINPVTTEIVFASFVSIVLLVLSGYASGAEVAFFSLTKKDLIKLKKEKNSSSKRIISLLEKPRYLLATILIANNLINISIIVTSYFVISNLFNFIGHPVLSFVFEVLIVTFLIVLFGEIIPKVFATRHNVKLARTTSYGLTYLEKFFRPFSFMLVKSTNFIEKRLHGKAVQQISIDEIDDAIDMTVASKSSKREVNILKGIIRFGNITVKQAMLSRVDMVAVDTIAEFKTVLDIISQSGFSRIPIYENDLDHITGIIYAKDLLEHLEQPGFEWQKLARQPLFVPENKKLNDLLEDFQSKRVHLAIVVDEYGGTSGIITLEDILEEIIGEIKDEYDDLIEIDYIKEDDKNYVFEAKTLINDVCKVMGIPSETFDKVRGDADSLGGIILEIAKKIPHIKEEVRYENFLFTVLSVDKKRIKKVKITLLSLAELKEVKIDQDTSDIH